MKITVLVENTLCDSRLQAEHGLSLYLEVGGKKILFDMGQSDRFAKNAEILGVDLETVDLAVLSHGHYDHGGGIPVFLEKNRHAPIYLNENAHGAYYNGTEKYIGLDASLAGNPRLVAVGEQLSLGNGMTLYSSYGKEDRWKLGSFGLNKKTERGFVPDDFCHEQYLLVEEGGKRILISGCSHRGILNIVDWFRPDVLIGGFHFSGIEPGETLAGYARHLASYDTAYFTGHCTGIAQCEFMLGYIPGLSMLSTGKCFEIG